MSLFGISEKFYWHAKRITPGNRAIIDSGLQGSRTGKSTLPAVTGFGQQVTLPLPPFFSLFDRLQFLVTIRTTNRGAYALFRVRVAHIP